MKPILEKVDGIADWEDQDIVFEETNPKILRAEQQLEDETVNFQEKARQTVKKLDSIIRKLLNTDTLDPAVAKKGIQNLIKETDHLQDVCSSFGFIRAGQISSQMFQMLDSSEILDEKILQEFESRLKILKGALSYGKDPNFCPNLATCPHFTPPE